jgi:large subunit ribosomal protein L19
MSEETTTVQAIATVPTNIPEALKGRAEIDFASGDTIKVTTKIKEANGKTRLQAFEGLCLARKHGNEVGGTFTIRKVASGVGVERIFPLYSSNIDKIEVVRHAKTRKSKLYYVRDKAMRDVRRKLKADIAKPSVEVSEEIAA